MSSIIFHWTLSKGTHPGINNPHARKRILSRWNLMAKAFGLGEDTTDGKPSLYCVTNDPNVQMKDAEIHFKTFEDLYSAIDYSSKDGEHVYIEEGGDDLSSFTHPKRAVYVFGSDYGELSMPKMLSFKSALPVHSETAAGVVLAHRFSQWH